MDIQQALYPNFTLFVQAGLFLVFVFLVNYFFVKPYAQVIEGKRRHYREELTGSQET